jgi:hypothetical protein
MPAPSTASQSQLRAFNLLAPAAAPGEILARPETACAGAVKDEACVMAAARAAQPPNHHATGRYSRPACKTILQNDIESKKRLIARLTAQK